MREQNGLLLQNRQQQILRVEEKESEYQNTRIDRLAAEQAALRQTTSRKERYYELGEAEGVMLAGEEFETLLRHQDPGREPRFDSFSEESRMTMQKEQVSGSWKYGDGKSI